MFGKSKFIIPAFAGFIAFSALAPVHAAEVDRREHRQQERIADGVEDRELTAEEVGKLEIKEARIKYQERRDRLEHGGKLTKRERERINRELDLLSKRIHEEKH